jgi:hypothetical protein
LPPYAPELNPIENVWEHLRGNKLAITVCDDYDDIVDKTCEAWNFFESDPPRIASVTARPWATVSPYGRWYITARDLWLPSPSKAPLLRVMVARCLASANRK